MNKKTQINDVINHLRKYKKITSFDAINEYGATRLSGIIFKLKERGFEIETEIVNGKTRYGNHVRYAVYHLVKDKEEVEWCCFLKF